MNPPQSRVRDMEPDDLAFEREQYPGATEEELRLLHASRELIRWFKDSGHGAQQPRSDTHRPKPPSKAGRDSTP